MCPIVKVPHLLRCISAALALSLGAGVAAAEVVVVVSATNATSALGKEQIVDIFLGKASSFPDGTQAVPIDQAEGTAARDEFYLRFAGKAPAQLKAHWSKIIFTGRGHPPREAASSAEVKKFVAASPGAIGYIDQDMVDGSIRVLRAP
jgi:ABC-type phosphate transport system substrate-binding protein